ncbi:hypothetical protein OAE79_01855 [Rhodopirellula sp.]|nr:hypothetical protein [Rhodopirellula sp.]MDB4679060.1 hypothetical protein [Rhodopirellula sp.]
MNRNGEKNLIGTLFGLTLASTGSNAMEHLKWLTILLFTMAGPLGCASRGGIFGIDHHADITAGAIPEPAGTKMFQIQQSQVEAAEQDQNVLYLADFIGKTSQLAPMTLDRLARRNAAKSLSLNMLTIEPSGDADLDQKRLLTVRAKLAEFGMTDVDTELAIPAALGLSGTVAESSLLGGRRSQGSGRGRAGYGGQSMFSGGF